MRSQLSALALSLTFSFAAYQTQAAERPQVAQVTSYADLADLALGAPIVLRGEIERFRTVPRKDSPGLQPGWQRYLVTLAVEGALVAPGPVPTEVRYLWDAPGERRPDIRETKVLAFARPVEGRPGTITLVHPNAQIRWTPAIEEMVRKQLLAARDPSLAGRRVTGITRAFHVPGTVPGEAETQFFLRTDSQAPVSLIVVSRPGAPKRMSAAFGDTIDEAAAQVEKGTLPWYYLACGLPEALPAESVEELSAEERSAVEEDYRFVLGQLGKCGRTLPDARTIASAAPSGPS